MATLIWLVLAIGLLPFVIGWWRLSEPLTFRRGARGGVRRKGLDGPDDASGGMDQSVGPADAGTHPFPSLGREGVILVLADALLCALAFNLIFFWQELWLVLPKAWAGLHPILYHNDHDWTGHAPIAELLQGTGALTTLASGIVFLIALGTGRGPRPFFAWMAFQGLFQALSQVAIGSLLAGNDVGRAFAYLGLGMSWKIAILALAVMAMAVVGLHLARRWPTRVDRRWLTLSVAMAVLLAIPFRVPRDPIEVVLIPVTVMLIGLGWLLLGASIATRRADSKARPDWRWPAAALIALLLVFQLGLRPGLRF